MSANERAQSQARRAQPRVHKAPPVHDHKTGFAITAIAQQIIHEDSLCQRALAGKALGELKVGFPTHLRLSLEFAEQVNSRLARPIRSRRPGTAISIWRAG